MTTSLEQADRFRAAVAAGDGAAVGALLHPDARLLALGKTLDGAAAVAAELGADATRDAWRALRWSGAEPGEAGIRLRGERADGTRDRGLVLTIDLDGDHVRTLKIQRTPPPHPDARPLRLPDALRRAIDGALVEKRPMLMAYVDGAGQPVLSFRGSTQVLDDDRLALWVRNAGGDFVRAIAANPRVSFMYRDEAARSTYQLQGRARVVDDPAVRDRVFERSAEAERAHDFARLGVAVVVELDRVEGWAGVGPQGQIDPINLRRGA